ncbi:MAG: YqhA family protein [Acidobacteriota bacterium]|jgi:uncharacterized membrane protein YqhA
MMSRFFAATRYLIIIPIVGLSLAAAAFFVVGGCNLIQLLIRGIGSALGLVTVEVKGITVINILDQVHQFLIGTVLYITSVGFYQLFIKDIEFHGWLKIRSIEELETSLVGVVVVVLAVDFLGTVFIGEGADLLNHGAGIALPIAALGLFISLRSRASHRRSGDVESEK